MSSKSVADFKFYNKERLNRDWKVPTIARIIFKNNERRGFPTAHENPYASLLKRSIFFSQPDRDDKILEMTGSRFIADSMLGKLAKWLRLAGLDVSYKNDIEDHVLIDQALSEDRIILTRDRNIRKRKIVKKCLLIHSDHLEEQIRQFFETYKIIDTERSFCRCIRCNTLLKDIEKRALKDKVPAYVLETNDKFKQCDSCNRIYWAGTHRENAERFLRRVIP